MTSGKLVRALVVPFVSSNRALHLSLLAAITSQILACSGSANSNQTGAPDATATGSGGSIASSGPPATGGVTATGGTITAGGANNSGGTSATGGAKATGGVTASGGTITAGGANNSGGTSATGGAKATGGVTATGGTITAGGANNSGGTSATGGAKATGGTIAAGGANNSGGTSATGGAKATGGATATGGAASGICDETSGLAASKIYYVSPTGSATATGASFSAPMNFTAALAAVSAGEMILLAPGTYPIAYTANTKNTIALTKSGSNGKPIYVVAANCGRATFDFSFPESTYVQDSFGFSLTGSYWYFKGINITRAGYQGAYVTGQYNVFENCGFYDNRCSGLEINKGGAYTKVINSDAYRNYDPKKYGGMADGFASKQTQGPGNHFIGCRAWENSDDGFDLFDSPEIVVIEDSWAFSNGVDIWKYGSFAGNGNGFKLGGNSVQANNRITRSVAFGNVVKGFDQNNNTGGITIHNCLGYNNGTNYGLGGTLNAGQRHDLKNNISLGAAANIANATEQNNSWNSGFSAGTSDFVSLDLTQARLARNPDGTLPTMTLFRLASGSKLIDQGVNVGLPYSGSAPDLGPFESAP